MGELAAQHSYDQKVREYGTKLKSDHTAHAAEIERMLEPLGVTIPTEPSAEALSQLAALERLSGEELDAAFIQMTIWTHTEAIEKYGAQTHANPDRSLHDFATRSLPMLREHLAAAEALR
jgi:putative membrane protein